MDNIKYLSPKQLIETGKYSLTIGQLRHLLLYRHKNGLEIAIRKIGKRLVIREDEFIQWIESKKENRAKKLAYEKMMKLKTESSLR